MRAKKFFSYIIIFVFLLILEVALLSGISLIPKDTIRKNVQISAEYFCKNAPFFHLFQNDTASRIDRHADAILVNLAWSCDTDVPLRSALTGSYYYNEYANENTNLLYAVTHDAAPTYDYMRYWHGSLVVLRPLLVLFSIKEIYILSAITLFCIMTLAAFCIYRTFGKIPFWGFLLSSCTCSIWYVPFSLEYMPAFIIGFASIPVIIALQNKYPQKIGYLFFILGSLTAYTDFLTTETLTCLLPLIFVLLTDFKAKSNPITQCIKMGFLWLCGYGATWISKWILYSAVTGKNGFIDALAQTAYRTGGEVAGGGLFSQICGALLRNLRCLLPFSYIKDPNGMVSVVVFLVITGILFYLIKKQKNMPSVVPALWLVGFLPYIRFVILSNHSFIHYFFTYRAQFASVFCLYLMFWLGTDIEFLKKEWQKRKKRK